MLHGAWICAVYNHSYKSNCEYEMDFENEIIKIKTIRLIEAGEELFINYNGDWNNAKKYGLM
jgi:Proteins containing SET domain